MVRILHLSDLHYRSNYPASNDLYPAMLHEMGDPMERLKKTLIKAGAYAIDVIVVSGDITDDGEEEEYRRVKEEIQSVFQDIPLLFVPGNHDVQSAYEKGLNCSYGTWSKDLLGLHWIGWNNTSHNSDGRHVTDEQILELKRAVVSDQPSVLIMHHSLFAQPGIPAPAETEEIASVLHSSNVQLILAGHTHHDLYTKFAGIPYSVSGSQAFLADNLEDGSVVFKTSGCCSILDFELDKEPVRHVLDVEEEREIAHWFSKKV